ncbi:glycosyltransferase [Xylanimonas sp. McL0601]|uniref:glycosyltransferase n=1 Tax=Xylanimonas sp. McL0601 TaxID=3414739 RepID=UPI003CEDE8CD
MPGRVSVIIPAHDEAAVIGRVLRALVASDADERLEIVVVANGCTDDTARVAAAASPRVTVVDIPTPSKIAALNAGDAAATAFPRAYLDADITVTAEAICAVADRLGADGPPYGGAPRLIIDTDGASLPVRLYYRVWELTEYRRRGMIGSGIYVVSAAGRARWGLFPDVIADDLYAQRIFEPHERLVADDQFFRMRAPLTFRSFLRRQTRIVAGNHEFADQFPELDHEGGVRSTSVLVGRVARRPLLWPAGLVYLVANVVPRFRAARLRARGVGQSWNRDQTSRDAVAEPDAV